MVPALRLFAPEPAAGPTRWGPWGEEHTVIVKPSMEAIQVDDVLHAVDRYLRTPNGEKLRETQVTSDKSQVT